jgi:uncharacterized Fe-S cluster-containing radical SAM superfamily protein
MDSAPITQFRPLDPAKFCDPDITAKGETRASVAPTKMTTLWFNTGTLCNITCGHCYIESSPTNDRLVYLTAQEVARYLDEAGQLRLGLKEIGFTGGEPFMNTDMIKMIEAVLSRGYDALVLTNAMKPMMRGRVQRGLSALREQYGRKLKLRVSIDHFDPAKHDEERGRGSFALAMKGLKWLASNGFETAVAGRALWGDSEDQLRDGYRAMFVREGISIDVDDPEALVLFPEMDERVDVPEITTACWGILKKSPDEMMCASSRMIVKRKGATEPVVLPCTLLPYDPQFEMGTRLSEAMRPVKLNHPHCAKFCVLGGGSCSKG